MSADTFRISVGLEEGTDGSILAHGLTLPGCAAWGATPPRAVAAFERALPEWLRLLAAAGEPPPPPDAELELCVDEWVRTDADVRAGASVACFAADLAALGEPEIAGGLRLLGELRGRLLTGLRRLPAAALDAESPAGWTARQILEELARATWWTLSRLGATPLAGLPASTLGRLDTAMALAVQQLAQLPPERRGTHLVLEGEAWTPRKVLRRLLWHEWALGRAARAAFVPLSPQPKR